MSKLSEWWFDRWEEFVAVIVTVVVIGVFILLFAGLLNSSYSAIKYRTECLSSGVVTQVGVTKMRARADIPWALVTRPDGSVCVALGVTADELMVAEARP